MAGVQVPLVMIPRFTTYAGTDTYYTIPLDCTMYDGINLFCWRSTMFGVGPTFALTLEESNDGVASNWTSVAGTTNNFDPGAATEANNGPGVLIKRWLRVKVVLAGSIPVASCYAVGFLQQRTQ